jgi:nucleotide-binding universal stress UspA family protein
MFRRILVPLDGSELAEQALSPAFELAHKFAGEVLLLCVAGTDEALVEWVEPLGPTYEPVNGRRAQVLAQTEAYLLEIKQRWLTAGVPIRTEVILGVPPERIVSVAQEQQVGLIVMSTHGRTGFSRLVYGSVAEAVLRGAHLPVLMLPIRHGDDHGTRH